MNYSEATDWLFSQIPNYQKQGGSAYKPGLETIRNLLSALGNPQHEFPSVHVAGTNGKGSVSHILAAVFQQNGYKTGLFTSPHLKDFRERIKIDGRMIPEEFVVEFVENLQQVKTGAVPSFFEITAAMAFKAFAAFDVDIAIVETGLGGRLDATNILIPEISVITTIGIDHTEFLGNSLAEIAAEKAGIIKPGVPVVIGEVLPETKSVFNQKAAEQNSRIYLPKRNRRIETDLLASYQQLNLQTADAVVEVMKEKGWKLDDSLIASAYKNVISITGFRGRLQKIAENPLILIDTAHNAHGLSVLMKEIRHFKFNQLHLIFGVSKEKDLDKMFSLFPSDAQYYFSEFGSSRSQSSAELKRHAEKFGLKFTLFTDSQRAFQMAKKNADRDDLILVCGSFFLLEELI